MNFHSTPTDLQTTDLLRLLDKYNRPGPRYTSYPTAPAFKRKEHASEHVQSLREAGNDISLYVHLPFCATLCYFCGCTMLVSNNRAKVSEYLRYLEREIEMTASELG